MACQMCRAEEAPLEDIADALFDDWLEQRITILKAYPRTYPPENTSTSTSSNPLNLIGRDEQTIYPPLESEVANGH